MKQLRKKKWERSNRARCARRFGQGRFDFKKVLASRTPSELGQVMSGRAGMTLAASLGFLEQTR